MAETQAQLFVNLDISFTALAVDRAALPPGDDLARARRREQVAIDDFPLQRPFLRNNAAFFRELRPGVATLPHSAPMLADAFETGTRGAAAHDQPNKDLEDVFDTLADFSQDPGARGGIDLLTHLSRRCEPTLTFLTPTQTVCNYATLWFRNAASLLADGDPHGTWQRFMVVRDDSHAAKPSARSYGPNNEGLSRRARPPTARRREPPALQPVPEHRAPGPDQGVRGGQRGLHATGKTTIGNRPGTRARRRRPTVQAKAMRRMRPEPHPAVPGGPDRHRGDPDRRPSSRSRRTSRSRSRTSSRPRFENAPPIQKSQAVRIAGVNVGKVSKVEPVGGDSPAVVVTMKLKDDALPIHKDATHQGAPAHLLRGQPLLRHPPGHAGSPELDTGDTIPASQTSAPVQLDQVLGTLQTDTRKDLQKLLEGYGGALNGEPQPGEDDDQVADVKGKTAGQSLNESLEYSPEALRGAAVVNQALLGVDLHDLSKLVAGQQKVFAALDTQRGSLKDLITNFNTTMGALAAERTNLRQTVHLLPRVLEAANPALDNAERGRSRPPARGRSR